MSERVISSPAALAAPYAPEDPYVRAAEHMRWHRWREELKRKIEASYVVRVEVISLPDGDNMLNIHESVDGAKADRMHAYASGFEAAVKLFKPAGVP